MTDVSSASAGLAWPPPGGPNSLPGSPQHPDASPHPRAPPPHHPLHHHPRLGHPTPPHRVPPIRPFFVREIYKNGFLKRLAHNEKKSSALSKLMRSDRYWVVFSIHDLGSEQLPFLELWHEPTEVASRPPQFMFPLSVCQHISPSLVPADNEWTFVVNFETVAIRFSCNSRQTMEEWVECIRLKLSEMGILNPKGNLYSKVPLVPGQNKSTPVTGRNPMSPLPEPPTPTTETPSGAPTAAPSSADSSETSQQPRTRASIVDVSDVNNQSFTTSIYLNQSTNSSSAAPSQATTTTTSTLASIETVVEASPTTPVHVIPAKSYEPVVVVPSSTSSTTCSTPSTTTTSTTSNSSGIKGIKWSVYLSKNKPSRHVTVIPINNNGTSTGVGSDGDSKPASPTELSKEYFPDSETLPKTNDAEDNVEEHVYDAIFELDDSAAATHPLLPPQPHSATSMAATLATTTIPTIPRAKRERKRQQSPTSRPPPLPTPYETIALPPTASESRQIESSEPRRSRTSREEAQLRSAAVSTPQKESVSRRLSDRLENRHPSGPASKPIQQQPLRIRKKSQRSSSLGPFLDDTQVLISSNLVHRSANTNSLESIDSNPRRVAAAKNDPHAYHHVGHGAVPRRPPLQPIPSLGAAENHVSGSSPPRMMADFPRPPMPPYMPLVLPPGMPGTSSGTPASATHPPHPPHIPLPGLTCQLTVVGPQPDHSHPLRPSLREQQVVRLRQEIAHPAGVRLMLRKRDCHGSLALVEFFGCLWVAGWKQRDYPVLYNAFHIGDQILSVSGVPVRTAHDFNKLIKQKSPLNHSGGASSGGPEALHVEIIIRRLPFAQVFHLKRDIEGQPLGIVTNGNTAEIREIIPASPASAHGMTSKIRSFDGQSVVPWVLTEINGRPLNLFSKDGEAGDRLQAIGRDVSVLLQPADIVSKLKKALKSHRNYKEYLLG